jgi:hypothetical protein
VRPFGWYQLTGNTANDRLRRRIPPHHHAAHHGRPRPHDTIASVTDCNIDGAPITADNGGPGTMVVTFDGVGEAIIFAYNDRSWQSDTPGQGQVTLNVFSGIPPWDTPRRCPTYTHP